MSDGIGLAEALLEMSFLKERSSVKGLGGASPTFLLAWGPGGLLVAGRIGPQVLVTVERPQRSEDERPGRHAARRRAGVTILRATATRAILRSCAVRTRPPA